MFSNCFWKWFLVVWGCFLMVFGVVSDAMCIEFVSSGGQSGGVESPEARTSRMPAAIYSILGLRSQILDTVVKSEGWGSGPGVYL